MEDKHTKVTCTVHSSYQHAWNQLWRKAYAPQNFIHGLESVQILEKSDDAIVREMKMGGMTIKERITRDEQSGTVKFHNLPDSDLQGNIYNHILKSQEGNENELELSFISSAFNKESKPVPNKEMFEKALLNTKKVIESTQKA